MEWFPEQSKRIARGRYGWTRYLHQVEASRDSLVASNGEDGSARHVEETELPHGDGHHDHETQGSMS